MDTIQTVDIVATVERFWGHRELRPHQEVAIRAGIERRDSLVVLPTGGGKSLCYQVPPVLARRTDVVVSPLIALMKDQVDGLRQCGYPAAALHSGMTMAEQRQAEESISAGTCHLIFVAPERLLTPRFLDLMGRARVAAFAVDEAHCISHWGHDFRPEYRQLAELKRRFPQASLHAYTATATERVRSDIIVQLNLQDPQVLVGTFDRPNLVYRVVPRVDGEGQAATILRRHPGQAAIVYCITRREAESMAAALRACGMRAVHYHAGMSAEDRRAAQDAFAREEVDVVAATVAFGMGIDRSDVRCVIHAAMPKSIEHYQQETGRAGRDGLEAECVLLYSAADVVRWEQLLQRNAADDGGDDFTATFAASRDLLRQMRAFASGLSCRHRTLSEYFGQSYPLPNCGACDVCLTEIGELVDATVTAQKILSCVARTGERFGAEHVLDVLLGSNNERVLKWRHNELTTYGLLKGTRRKEIASTLHQLLDNHILERSSGERPILQLNPISWEVMRGQRRVWLRPERTAEVEKTAYEASSWEGVDRGLFDSLRELRRSIADQRGVPAFVVFGDATLRDLARLRPSTRDAFLAVRGVGERKLAELGDIFLAHVGRYCEEQGLPLDVEARDLAPPPSPPAAARPRAPGPAAASELFARGASIEEVCAALDRRPSTVLGYLEDWIRQTRPQDLTPWVDPATYERITKAIGTAHSPLRLRPIFDELGGTVDYGVIRLVVAHCSLTPPEAPADGQMAK